jgi:hypothetical protein
MWRALQRALAPSPATPTLPIFLPIQLDIVSHMPVCGSFAVLNPCAAA